MMDGLTLIKKIKVDNAVYLETKIPSGMSFLTINNLKVTGQLDILTAKKRWSGLYNWNIAFQNILGKEEPFIVYGLYSKHLLFKSIQVFEENIFLEIYNQNEKPIFLRFNSKIATIERGEFKQYNSTLSNINSGTFKLANY